MNIQTLKYLKNLQWVFLISAYILCINLCMNEIEKAETQLKYSEICLSVNLLK